MIKKYLFLVSCFAVSNLEAWATSPIQYPIPTPPPSQTQYDNSRGSVTGIMNRIPRNFDTQTLINSGPGLLEESFLLLKKLGNKTPQNPDTQKETTVTEPQAPTIPTTQEVIYKETSSIFNTSNQDTNKRSSSNTIFTNSSINQAIPNEAIKQDFKEPIFTKNEPIAPTLMVPAPKPGYIIRYNEQLKVYEEVREIKIQEIQTIQP